MTHTLLRLAKTNLPTNFLTLAPQSSVQISRTISFMPLSGAVVRVLIIILVVQLLVVLHFTLIYSLHQPHLSQKHRHATKYTNVMASPHC